MAASTAQPDVEPRLEYAEVIMETYARQLPTHTARARSFVYFEIGRAEIDSVGTVQAELAWPKRFYTRERVGDDATVILWPPSLTASTAPTATTLPPDTQLAEAVYRMVQATQAQGAMRILYRGIEDILAAQNFRILNSLLSQIELDRLTPELMVALIRATYRARFATPNWYKTLERIRASLEARRVPAWANLLVGLPTQAPVDGSK